MNKINLSENELEEVKKIFRDNLPANSKVYVFGSRITDKIKKYSDLDLAFDFGRKMTLDETAKLREEFSNSNLIFTVDIVDLHSISHDFKAKILNDCIEIVYN